jgi:predicted ATPase/signal transduction histidine kinase
MLTEPRPAGATDKAEGEHDDALPRIRRDGTLLVDDGELALYRGPWSSVPKELRTALFRIASQDRASDDVSRRLSREFGFRHVLGPTWSASPISLIVEAERAVGIVLADGGEPLSRLVGGKLEAEKFLALAIAVAAAIDEMHRNGIVHKDVKPANILIGGMGQMAKLTGFGFADTQPEARGPAVPGERIPGTLAYMAPEQTGRVDQPVDARSDLYSLGVTFYELLAGTVPFTASDPIALLYQHIAKAPQPLAERRPEVPIIVSDLVQKLLAKDPEHRYQTAAALLHDLKKCQADLKSQGVVSAFKLGTFDRHDAIRSPERLHGRDAQLQHLLSAFADVATVHRRSHVLISGASGVGKSALVQEFIRQVAPQSIVIAGKSEQYARDVPYASMAQGLQALARFALAQPADDYDRWQKTLATALGANGQLLIDLAPDFRFLLGPQPQVPDLPPEESRNRFRRVLGRTLQACCAENHPLVLFIDDLQWLDDATQAFLSDFITAPDVQNLLFVGACRSDHVDDQGELSKLIATLKAAPTPLLDLHLDPLTPGELTTFVTDCLFGNIRLADEIAAEVHRITGGNPFFALQVVSDAVRQGESDSGEKRPRTDGYTLRTFDGKDESVVTFVTRQIERMPEATQRALMTLAALGTAADDTTVQALGEDVEIGLGEGVAPAVSSKLVVHRNGRLAFAHDRVQEAAYTLIAAEDRPDLHRRIGLALSARLTASSTNEQVFAAIGQLNQARSSIHDPALLLRMAELNLTAGLRARQASAYASALTYFATGASLVSDDAWQTDYDLIFSLHRYRAEAELLNGQLDAADALLSELIGRAVSRSDEGHVTSLRMWVETVRNRGERSIELALEFLRQFDIDWTLHPSPDQVTKEYDALMRDLGDRPVEALADLAPVLDPGWKAAMIVLADMFAASRFNDDNLFYLVIARVVRLSLVHGNTDVSCLAYGYLAEVLSVRFGNPDLGYRFGRLSLDLADDRGWSRYRGRVYQQFGTCVVHWTQPLREVRDYVDRAFDVLMEAGDLGYAAFSRIMKVQSRLASGAPLAQVAREAEKSLAFGQRFGFDFVKDLTFGQIMFVSALQGHTNDLTDFSIEEVDEEEYRRNLHEGSGRGTQCFWYWLFKLRACVYAGDAMAAGNASAKAASFLWTTLGLFHAAEFRFFAAMASVLALDGPHAAGPQQDRATLDEHHAWLEQWAEACPSNFRPLTEFLKAELDRLDGRALEALAGYEQASRLLKEQGLVHIEALCEERAARHAIRIGLRSSGSHHLAAACTCYDEWGARAKVERLRAEFADLRGSGSEPTNAAALSLHDIDVTTLVRVSQAFSGELVLSSLVRTLLSTMLQTSGADRGLLLLPSGDDFLVCAEGRVGEDAPEEGVDVVYFDEPAHSGDFPLGMVRLVARTHDSQSFSNAGRNRFGEDDPYLRAKRLRSALCLPLMHQGDLRGVVYLENTYWPGPRAETGLATLEVLTAQAAISLENATLYSNLAGENLERRKAEEAFRLSQTYLAEAQRLSSVGSWAWDVRSRQIVHASAQMFRLFDWEPREDIPDWQDWTARIVEPDRAPLLEALDRAVRDAATFEQDARVLDTDGAHRYLQFAGAPFHGADGTLTQFVGTTIDRTDQKRAEDGRQALAHATRVMALGQMTASIAHEINQPLAAIAANSSSARRWLERSPPEMGEALAAVARITSDVERVGEVIDGIRSLAGKAPMQTSLIDLNEAVREVVELTRSELISHRVSLLLALDPGIPPVVADPVQIRQVIINLVLNAIEAMADGSKFRELTVETRSSERWIEGRVSDTGPGFASEAAAEVFDPFYTTKATGMGLGLAISRSIIESFGGTIKAESNQPSGAVVTFQLPLTGTG